MFPKKEFLSMTSDLEKEFGCYPSVEEVLGVPFYFVDAYSVWQRGINENSNGLLREFYPKKTDLSLIDNNELKSVLNCLNIRREKCLSFNTPFEEFTRELHSL